MNEKLSVKGYSKEQFTFDTIQIVTVGVLTALFVVLNRFASINIWNMSIGFTFIPLVVAAMLMGPLKAGIVGGLGDLIGALLFPFGPYFPGFTLTAFIRGFVFGVVLYKKASIFRIILGSAISEFILSLVLQSYWIFYLYGSKTYPAIIVSRVPLVVALFVVEIIVTPLIAKFLIGRLEPFMKQGKMKKNKVL